MDHHIRNSCDCLFCLGENGKRLISIPFDLAESAGLVADAKRDRVTIKRTDQLFVVDGIRAIGCVRFIRRKLARLCGCWVAKEFRGQGYGEMLVRHRICYIERHTSAQAIDTFAFRKPLFQRLGFQSRAGFKIGTTLWRKVINRER